MARALLTLMAALAVCAACAPALAQPRTDAGLIVRLGQVADLSGAPAALRQRAAALPIARLSAGLSHVRPTGSMIADRARRQMPALSEYLARTAPLTVTIHRASLTLASSSPTQSQSDGAASANCARVKRPIKAGQALAIDDLVPAACDPEQGQDWFLDPAAGVARARSDLDLGKILIAPPQSLLARVAAGQAVRLTAQVGTVSIERQVTAVQSSRGGRVFVQGANGAVFAIGIDEVAP